MTRFWCTAHANAFVSQKSGDLIGEGEFYFEIDAAKDTRIPAKGEWKVSKKELFRFPGDGVLLTSAMLEDGDEWKFKLRLREADRGRDDTLLKEKLEYEVKKFQKKITLTSGDGKVTVEVTISMIPKDDW